MPVTSVQISGCVTCNWLACYMWCLVLKSVSSEWWSIDLRETLRGTSPQSNLIGGSVDKNVMSEIYLLLQGKSGSEQNEGLLSKPWQRGIDKHIERLVVKTAKPWMRFDLCAVTQDQWKVWYWSTNLVKRVLFSTMGKPKSIKRLYNSAKGSDNSGVDMEGGGYRPGWPKVILSLAMGK